MFRGVDVNVGNTDGGTLARETQSGCPAYPVRSPNDYRMSLLETAYALPELVSLSLCHNAGAPLR